MKKFAIAILLSAGTLISVQAHAGGGAVIGAVDGALVGSYFGGAHGAVAGAIIGAAVGSSADNNYYYDRRGRFVEERDYERYEPSPAYYPQQGGYQPSYQTYYEPQPVVYVESPVYASYPIVYGGYRGPVYYGGGYRPRGAYYTPQRGNYGHGYYGHGNYGHVNYDHHRRY